VLTHNYLFVPVAACQIGQMMTTMLMMKTWHPRQCRSGSSAAGWCTQHQAAAAQAALGQLVLHLRGALRMMTLMLSNGWEHQQSQRQQQQQQEEACRRAGAGCESGKCWRSLTARWRTQQHQQQQQRG
jgi:hypothetical protein